MAGVETIIVRPKVLMQGTVIPSPNFNAETAADSLHKAMQGLGTDDKEVISVLSHHSNDQRQEIEKKYNSKFEKDLRTAFKADLSGKYEYAAEILFDCPVECDARELNRAMARIGTDESTLVEILFTRPNKTIQTIKGKYEALFGKSLSADIDAETSGNFRDLLLKQLAGERDESSKPNLELARQDAQEMYAAGEGRLGTNEMKLSTILCARSFRQLKESIKFYREHSGHDIEDGIRSETCGDLREAYIDIVQMARSIPGYFAQRINKFTKGLGTNDKNLIRVIVSRSEVDLVQIKQEYEKLYNVTLASTIKDETSSDYRKLLLALIGERV